MWYDIFTKLRTCTWRVIPLSLQVSLIDMNMWCAPNLTPSTHLTKLLKPSQRFTVVLWAFPIVLLNVLWTNSAHMALFQMLDWRKIPSIRSVPPVVLVRQFAKVFTYFSHSRICNTGSFSWINKRPLIIVLSCLLNWVLFIYYWH